MKQIYSYLTWLTMALTSVIITPFFLLVWVLTFWWDRRRVAAHLMGTFWAWHYQSLVPVWRIRLNGREKIPWNKPVVLVANHRSLVDIIALFKIRRPFKWTSKQENFRLPFVGMVLSLTGSIPVRRESTRAGSRFIRDAEAAMNKGSSIMLFPEGTRSKKPRMRSFKDGAFLLAKRMEAPIIPIVHSGTEKCFHEKGRLLIAPSRIRIQVLDEIPAEQVRDMALPELISLVRTRMEAGLLELDKKNT